MGKINVCSLDGMTHAQHFILHQYIIFLCDESFITIINIIIFVMKVGNEVLDLDVTRGSTSANDTSPYRRAASRRPKDPSPHQVLSLSVSLPLSAINAATIP